MWEQEVSAGWERAYKEARISLKARAKRSDQETRKTVARRVCVCVCGGGGGGGGGIPFLFFRPALPGMCDSRFHQG